MSDMKGGLYPAPAHAVAKHTVVRLHVSGYSIKLLTLTNAPDSRMICLMLAPPAPMIAPTAELGTLICSDSFAG